MLVKQMRNFKQSLPMALLRTRETIMGDFRNALRNHGLTEQQWRVLRCLRESEGIDAKTLAKDCMILRPSMSRILKILVGKKLIQKSRLVADQRKIILILTTKGCNLFLAHTPESEAIYKKMEKKIGKEKLKELINLLHEVNEKLK